MSAMIGPYQILGELGRGAMAVVWRAWDPKLEREVAIKEPMATKARDVATEAELAARFVREGKAAAQLNHPGIVTIFGADIFDGRPAIVMELIEGETLGDVLRRGAMSPASAVAVLDQLLDAVAYAHGRGIVHRDIKPDNVFITADGRVKLTDFGIAHVGSTAALTQAGTVMGTPGYMSPEQVTGQPVDARADLFSIGVLAYEMLVGRNPFGAEYDAPTTVMYRIVHEQPASLPTMGYGAVPGNLASVISSAMAKNPADRFQSATAFRAGLRGGSLPVASSGSAAGLVEHGIGETGSHGTMPGWLAYAAVGGIGIVILGVLLLSAGGAPTGGGPAALAGEASTGAAQETQAESPAPSAPEPAADPGPTITVAARDAFIGDSVAIEVGLAYPESDYSVTVYVDGQEIGADSTAPYEFSYDSGSEGIHEITADVVATDGSSWSPEPATLEVTDETDAAAAVETLLGEWNDSFANLDLEQHVACYADVVSPYFNKSSATHSEVRENKRGVFSKTYSLAEMYIENVDVAVIDPDTAEATFDKTWDFISDTRFAGSERQRLRFGKTVDGWKITSEEELEIYWVTRE